VDKYRCCIYNLQIKQKSNISFIYDYIKQK
jgi:hypothetical protein